MRIFVLALALSLCIAHAVSAAAVERAEQRLLDVRITDGHKGLLETRLATIVGYEAYASNVLGPGGDPSLGTYIRISTDGVDFNQHTGPGATAWNALPDSVTSQLEMFRCGGMMFEIYAPRGSQIDLVVSTLPTVTVHEGMVTTSKEPSERPQQIARLSAPLN